MAGLTAGLRGCLDVCFRDHDGHTTAALTSTPPLDLRGPFKRDRGAELYLLRNTTAGILAGDDHDLRVTAEPGANVRVASTAATKVLTMPGDGARIHSTLTAQPGSSLVWGPHATVLQTGSRLTQSTHVALSPGASLVLAEVIVFGRLASGQKYDFAAYESDLVIADDCWLRALRRGLSSRTRRLNCARRSAIRARWPPSTSSAPPPSASMPPACRTSRLSGCSRLPNDAGVIARSLAPSLSRGLAFVDCLLAPGCY